MRDLITRTTARDSPNCEHDANWVRLVIPLATERDHVACAQGQIGIEGRRIPGITGMAKSEVSYAGNPQACDIRGIRRILVEISSLELTANIKRTLPGVQFRKRSNIRSMRAGSLQKK